ncbi:MAG: hypothetical protein HFG26_01295 [Provencibacterium sp.]|nr:hypothetical protein [Provencibacterium sp.]
MRLSEVLSSSPTSRFEQVEGFLNNMQLKRGKQKKISVGAVWLTYHCENCHSDLTFVSDTELYCIGIHERLVSIDCALRCPRCGESVPIWFLIESKEAAHGIAPEVRVLKRSEKLSDKVTLGWGQYEGFSELLEKADRAYRDELGAGAIVYLRKILERITKQTAEASNISITITTKNGDKKRKDFKKLLTEVDQQCFIIPKEFSENGYKLFGELSEIIHSDGSDEQMVLKKYDALHRLVIGILDNVKNNKEMMEAIGTLGWNAERDEAV